MGSSYSKMIREIEKIEREKEKREKLQKITLQREWNKLQETISVLRKEVAESKANNIKIVGAVKSIWDGIETRNDYLIKRYLRVFILILRNSILQLY